MSMKLTRLPVDLLVVADGRLMDIPVTRVYHRHFPEARGEGRSLGEASRHLAWLLARGLDHVCGPRREALERALADVGALRPNKARAPPRSVALA